MVLIVLFCLKIFVSPVYVPNRFWLGVSFGLLAGFLEEIGWTVSPTQSCAKASPSYPQPQSSACSGDSGTHQ
jgi:hypothetical protein